MKVGDVEPYTTHISQNFQIKGWLDSIAVQYTAGGNLELKVTYTKTETSTTSVSTALTPTTQDSGVHFSGLNGQVEILLPGAKDWQLAKINSIMPVGTHIRTDEDSSCVLSFSDMSMFVLKAESELVVNSPPEKDSKIQVVRGTIWANVKKMIKDGSMDIEMNQAVCGIKGTTLICEETVDGSSAVKVIEGTVQVNEKAHGAIASLTDGQTITANRYGFGAIKPFDAIDETTVWEAIRTDAVTNSANTNDTKAASAIGSSFPVLPVAIGGGVVVIIALGIAVTRSRKKQ